MKGPQLSLLHLPGPSPAILALSMLTDRCRGGSAPVHPRQQSSQPRAFPPAVLTLVVFSVKVCVAPPGAAAALVPPVAFAAAAAAPPAPLARVVRRAVAFHASVKACNIAMIPATGCNLASTCTARQRRAHDIMCVIPPRPPKGMHRPCSRSRAHADHVKCKAEFG